ncbi:hypothetical protein J4G37_21615, partial [Microvirga sp. 3-52]|nr:hypothetical protein [Microvirga sp. 3-52]
QTNRHQPYAPADKAAREDPKLLRASAIPLCRVVQVLPSQINKRSTGASIDAEEVDQVREALERLEVRQNWQGKPFSRKDVNERLSKIEYLDLMHQQW